MVKAKADVTEQLCNFIGLPKRWEGCIFQRGSLLKFSLSLHHHQCTYCYKFRNKFLELKHLLLSKIKADEDKSCYHCTKTKVFQLLKKSLIENYFFCTVYLDPFSTKDFNFNFIKHNRNKDTMGAAQNSCCVVAR